MWSMKGGNIRKIELVDLTTVHWILLTLVHPTCPETLTNPTHRKNSAQHPYKLAFPLGSNGKATHSNPANTNNAPLTYTGTGVSRFA